MSINKYNKRSIKMSINKYNKRSIKMSINEYNKEYQNRVLIIDINYIYNL